MNGKQKPWRANVLAIAGALVLVAVGSMYGSAVVVGDALTTGFQALGTIAVTGLVAFGKDILTMDANPFDTDEAKHTERMLELQMADTRTVRQMELDHEYRNSQNEAQLLLITAATGGTGAMHPRE